MKRMKQKGGISAGTWREYLILAAVMLPLTFCVSCGQTELPPVNDEDSSDISIAHIIEEEPEENSSELLSQEPWPRIPRFFCATSLQVHWITIPVKLF